MAEPAVHALRALMLLEVPAKRTAVDLVHKRTILTRATALLEIKTIKLTLTLANLRVTLRLTALLAILALAILAFALTLASLALGHVRVSLLLLRLTDALHGVEGLGLGQLLPAGEAMVAHYQELDRPVQGGPFANGLVRSRAVGVLALAPARVGDADLLLLAVEGGLGP